MFNCIICKKVSDPYEKASRVILEQRFKKYPYRENANTFVKFAKKTHSDDPGGTGKEIVKEGLAHRRCANEYESIHK